MNRAQYDQLADAMLALPDTDQKANLVQIASCIFTMTDPNFDPFRFVQHAYVKHSYRATLEVLEENVDKRLRA